MQNSSPKQGDLSDNDDGDGDGDDDESPSSQNDQIKPQGIQDESSKKRPFNDDVVETEGPDAGSITQLTKVSKAAADADEHPTAGRSGGAGGGDGNGNDDDDDLTVRVQHSQATSSSAAQGEKEGLESQEEKSGTIPAAVGYETKNQENTTKDVSPSQIYTDNIMAACMAATEAHVENLKTINSSSDLQASRQIMLQQQGNDDDTGFFGGQPESSALMFALKIENLRLRQRNEALQNELTTTKQQVFQLLTMIAAATQQARQNIDDGSARSSGGNIPSSIPVQHPQQQFQQSQTAPDFGPIPPSDSIFGQHRYQIQQHVPQLSQQQQQQQPTQSIGNVIQQSQQILQTNPSQSTLHLQQHQFMNRQNAGMVSSLGFPNLASNLPQQQQQQQQQQKRDNVPGLHRMFGPNIAATNPQKNLNAENLRRMQEELQQKDRTTSESTGPKEQSK
jgi:hypothetical protein